MADPPQLIVREHDRLVIYSDKRKMLRRLTLRLIPGFVLILAMSRFTAYVDPGRPLFIVMEFDILPWLIAVMYVAMFIRIRRQKNPIVTLAPEGIYVYSVLTELGLIRWEEISNVFVYDLMYRYVGIVPLDPSSLYKRAGRRATLSRINGACAPLYSLFGKPIAPVNIPQEYLPMSAYELLQTMNEYKSSLRPIEVVGEWPPPPGAHQGDHVPG